MSLIRSLATVGGYTMASRILGFVRDMLFAAFLAAGPVADAFFVAFKLPNLFRRLFAEGAFNAAFVPMFAGKLEADGAEAALAYGRRIMGLMLWGLLGLVLAMEIAMPWAMRLFAPGFLDDPDKFSLAVLLTRITFPYLLFVSLVALGAGVLNSLDRFAAAAATPILLNLCLIGALLGLAPLMPTPGHALAWGVAVAGVVQLLWILWNAARNGMRLIPARPRWDADTRTTIKRIIPGAIGAGVYQINLVVDMIIASLLPTGSISYLYYADRINQLPLGVVGVAAGTALLPMLSRQLRAGDEAAAHHSQNRTIEFTLLLTVPAAVAFVVIAMPLVRGLFERGAFGPEETAATAAALSVYALGLPAFVLIKTLTPGFFARGDTVTPVRVAVAAMAVNLVVAVILMGPLKHVGIASAAVVSGWVNTALLTLILHRRGQLQTDARLRRRLPRILAASAGMGVFLWLAMHGLDGWLAAGQTQRVAALAMLVMGGLAVFFVLGQLLGAAHVAEFRQAFRKRA